MTVTVAALVVALLASGCSRSDARPPSRTVREERTTSSTSTTTLEQSYAIPDVIDVAYVNRVLAALDEIHGRVARGVLETRQLTQEDLVPLRAIYNDPLFAAMAKGVSLLTDEEPARVRQPVGTRKTVAVEILAASATCIHTAVTVDISAVVIDPPRPRRAFLELRPTQQGADPLNINRTPWSLSNEDQQLEPRCES